MRPPGPHHLVLAVNGEGANPLERARRLIADLIRYTEKSGEYGDAVRRQHSDILGVTVFQWSQTDYGHVVTFYDVAGKRFVTRLVWQGSSLDGWERWADGLDEATINHGDFIERVGEELNKMPCPHCGKVHADPGAVDDHPPPATPIPEVFTEAFKQWD